VAVAAVGRDDLVIGREMLAHADRDGFLAAVEVGEAGDFAGLDVNVETFFELADDFHLAIGSQQLVAAELHLLSPGLLASAGG
jgi:hypothetical protein